MNPLPRRSSLLTQITSLLTFLLAVTWIVSFFNVIQLHQIEVGSNFSQVVVGGSPKIILAKQEEPNNAAAANHNRQTDQDDDSYSSKDVHVVFSTDCSGYQHWQSIVSYYSLRRAGHMGPITRIVSGCSSLSQEEAIRTEFHKIQRRSVNHQLRLHFTPSFALGGKNYKYSNKPGGLYSFINHTLLNESVMALVDPDMMALRPIIPQLGEHMTSMPVTRDGYRDLVEYKDEHGRVTLLRRKQLPSLPPRITKGVAAGQHFGLGGWWASAGTKNARNDFKEFNLTMVCGQRSPCLNVPPKDSNGAYTTREFADNNYAVGPVYIASTLDWMDLLPRWHAFTPRVHAQYPKLLAEMYAFTMAAADMQLKFALSSSYMVSDPKTMSTTEAWLWVDEYAKKEHSSTTHGNKERPVGNALRSVCEGATPYSLPKKTMRRLENYGYGNYHYSGGAPVLDEGAGALPTFLHYCQTYKLANHTFAKRKMPHDFFRCDGLPLKLDAEAMMNELDSVENDISLPEVHKKKQMRTGFMLCHLIPLMNMALDDYKSDVC
mmetsp:Transcript_18288/g.39529  ORF Transcript_18288/g.39529 Transcript_18288/m.39529 type:complete len:546 (+) Transcript_18288:265-1902(+)|eukprot:CAMPEP_0172324280 /NCGR_PEP_ID=MMETSP1058-20130122/50946_1 /TAXON_ID=83371 /ORGANISM="Detonula confervacea, Strain CCMP 353" /LENGTH=545 /DNA_ID=CAMNT_0013040515 /DNA_START=233 /DNA_END=1870 /DNA_ORIENTATION=+